mgnify:CR=1 FL=1
MRAIENNNLEMLKYVIENGCPWYDDACYDAVSKNNLEMLIYIR